MRICKSFFLAPLLFFGAGCASAPRPISLSGKSIDEAPSSEAAFLQRYALAKKQQETTTTTKKETCKVFAELSRETTFSLKALALLRAHISCSELELQAHKVSATPQDLQKELGTNPSHFLRPLNDLRIMAEAERSKDPALLAKAFRAKALASDKISEKIDLLQKALAFAKKSFEEKSSQDLSVDSVDEIQNRIYSLAPRLKPEILPEDFQKVGADWAYNRNFEKARFYFEKMIDPRTLDKEPNETSTQIFEAQYQALKAIRSTYKVEQNREMHIQISEKMTHWLIQKKAAPALIQESYLTWARSLWTTGQTAIARKTLLNGKTFLLKRAPTDEFDYILGRMDEEAKDYTSALEHYIQSENQLLKPKIFPIRTADKTKAFRYERTLFSKAWALRNLGRMLEAAEVLENLAKQTRDPFDIYRFQFWQARSLKQAGKADQAQAILQKLKTEDSLGYYGLLAFYELNEKLPPLLSESSTVSNQGAPPAKLSEESFSALDNETRKMIAALITVDEAEVLEKYLAQKTQELRSSGNQNPELWLAYFKAYAAGGLFLPLFNQLGTIESNLKIQLLKEHPDLLFPKKYSEIILPWSAKLKVKPELAYSIIRQESAFNTMARSPADAFGLMQVLPKVANEQEPVTKIKLKNFEDLFRPEVNIPVGISLLAELNKKYRGQFILAAAAYNSSEQAIEGWLKTRLKEDPLEFIEDIPYDETRAYVKLVLRNFIFYSRLNQPDRDIEFPAWCFENLQSFKPSTH